MEAYAGLVTNMDYHVGRMMNFLQDIGEYDNTIVLFLSDNGPNPWSSEDYPGNAGSKWFAQFDNRIENIGHPMSHYAYGMGWGSASAGPLDLFKMTVGEGGIRSPLLVAGPGVKSGVQTDTFGYVWDIMPTILDITDIQHPKKFGGNKVERMRGRSLSGVLNGTSRQVYSDQDYVGGEMQNGKWMRQGDYKAVSVAPPYGAGTWHLYNLAEDPGETNDLTKSHPAILQRLQHAWEDYADEVGVILTE
jgi:arylsulfatase